jgi:hypothetical protein
MVQGVRSSELIQNTDFVPTWFELAGAARPMGYRDGRDQPETSFSQPYQTPVKRFPQLPFGEFVPVGNAIPGGSYEDVFKIPRIESHRKKSKDKKK